MSAWYLMPTPADARRAGVSAELDAALANARCALQVLEARLRDSGDRVLVEAALRELCAAIEATRALQ